VTQLRHRLKVQPKNHFSTRTLLLLTSFYWTLIPTKKKEIEISFSNIRTYFNER
jgi:hypothetical protein